MSFCLLACMIKPFQKVSLLPLRIKAERKLTELLSVNVKSPAHGVNVSSLLKNKSPLFTFPFGGFV